MNVILTNVNRVGIDTKVSVATHQPLKVTGKPEYTASTLDTYHIEGISTDTERKTIMAADDGSAHQFTIPLSATLSVTDWFLITHVKFQEVGGYSMDYYRYTLDLIRLTAGGGGGFVSYWPQVAHDTRHSSLTDVEGAANGNVDWVFEGV